MVHNEKAGIETKLIVDEKVQWGQAGTYNSYIIGHTAGHSDGTVLIIRAQLIM